MPAANRLRGTGLRGADWGAGGDRAPRGRAWRARCLPAWLTAAPGKSRAPSRPLTLRWASRSHLFPPRGQTAGGARRGGALRDGAQSEGMGSWKDRAPSGGWGAERSGLHPRA